MIVPNKVISYSESIIGKMLYVLKRISEKEVTIEHLYLSTQDYFEEVDEFIYSLDVLYLLDAIQVDFNKGVVKYVKRD
ncbi:ABC-three component system middle component 7 [Bacillus massilinigeriensis]|uniref:ABC-three component system middle component 7 n=1 Tax=Bacillus mediterraneensis TaxID=1805474 RepID=UPI0008F8B247|nr:ABC-three component system middle component 7 [Bacillus mediterraneensis]